MKDKIVGYSSRNFESGRSVLAEVYNKFGILVGTFDMVELGTRGAYVCDISEVSKEDDQHIVVILDNEVPVDTVLK